MAVYDMNRWLLDPGGAPVLLYLEHNGNRALAGRYLPKRSPFN